MKVLLAVAEVVWWWWWQRRWLASSSQEMTLKRVSDTVADRLGPGGRSWIRSTWGYAGWLADWLVVAGHNSGRTARTCFGYDHHHFWGGSLRRTANSVSLCVRETQLNSTDSTWLADAQALRLCATHIAHIALLRAPRIAHENSKFAF